MLARGGILALLGDQHAGPKGCWVDFFGRPASSHKAIALFALAKQRADRVLLLRGARGQPLHLLMGTARHARSRARCPAEMRSVPAITEWYTRLLEHTIRQAPAQYWWVHRRWKDNRPKRKIAVQDRAA